MDCQAKKDHRYIKDFVTVLQEEASLKKTLKKFKKEFMS